MENLSIIIKGTAKMNLGILALTDTQLVTLSQSKPNKRAAMKEITRRKAVGAWRLVAGYKPDVEQVSTLGERKIS